MSSDSSVGMYAGSGFSLGSISFAAKCFLLDGLYLMGLKKLVKNLSLEDRVEFHTNVPFKFVKDALARAKG